MPKEIRKARKKKRTIKSDNLGFIATYLFEFPGSSATDVRRALWMYRNKEWKEIEKKGFSIRRSYISYFQTTRSASQRGYAGKYWQKTNRSRWILTSDGLFRVDKRLIKKVNTINKRVTKYKKSCRRGVR